MSGGALPDLSINLADLPAPQIFEKLDYQETFNRKAQELNALAPLLFDIDHQPVNDVIEAQVVETDQGLMFQIPVSEYAGLHWLKLHSDPMVKAIQYDAYEEMRLTNQRNRDAQSVMPAFATGANLDHLVAPLKRRVITEQDDNATPPIPAVYESDNSLRNRFLLSKDANSHGGALTWYLFQVFNADPRVKDARITTPSPLHIEIIILSYEDGNGTASQDLLDTVFEYVTRDKNFPQGDVVNVISAEIIEYEIIADVMYYKGASIEVVNQQIQQAYEAYKSEREKIGVSVWQGPIDKFLQQSGVHRALINSPNALPIDIDMNHQAPFCTGITLIDGGRYGDL